MGKGDSPRPVDGQKFRDNWPRCGRVLYVAGGKFYCEHPMGHKGGCNYRQQFEQVGILPVTTCLAEDAVECLSNEKADCDCPTEYLREK